MSIWVEKISKEILKERSRNTLAEYLNIEFIEIGEDYLIATMPVNHTTVQPMRILNGGASCALAETVASTAANHCVDQSKNFCVGLDINANHLKSAKEGDMVRALTKPIHLGRSTQVWSVDIFNQENEHVCIARMTL